MSGVVTDPVEDRAASSRPVVLPGAGAIAVAVIGLAFGLAATAVVIGHGWDPGAVAVGPWVSQPKVGTTAIDPYAQAGLARSGSVPIAASEGLSLLATTDDAGFQLLRSCSYHLSGGMLPARFWTLTATDRDGLTLDDAAERSAFTSTTVIRDATGQSTIEIGPEARPGNWLPTSGEGPLALRLRLYDTPLTGTTADIARAALPSLTLQACGTGR